MQQLSTKRNTWLWTLVVGLLSFTTLNSFSPAKKAKPTKSSVKKSATKNPTPKKKAGIAQKSTGKKKVVYAKKSSKKSSRATSVAPKYIPEPIDPNSLYAVKRSLFDSLHLEELGLSRLAYDLGLKGMDKLQRQGKVQHTILSIVDFSKSSLDKRLFVIDLANDILLFNTYVAHGRNSGKENAMSFSNKPKSNKSSLGFYVTANTYYGSNGYSLKLVGLEKNFNSNAFKRAIVIHGAEYATEDYGFNQGYLGRSQGCPAVPSEISEPLIDSIKDGSCLFIYHPSANYLKLSSLAR
ncbi:MULTISPECIES: murein L,D-transpeptidase catalytic domain-containing protein [unclassified Paraflavitalea]|uniref:murein L,D-transpeptidase catalytic domain family protein n=1 Tax=unclassified Paraflavitalea TaxID=2798305 RepID=UPI003D3293D1